MKFTKFFSIIMIAVSSLFFAEAAIAQSSEKGEGKEKMNDQPYDGKANEARMKRGQQKVRTARIVSTGAGKVKDGKVKIKEAEEKLEKSKKDKSKTPQEIIQQETAIKNAEVKVKELEAMVKRGAEKLASIKE